MARPPLAVSALERLYRRLLAQNLELRRDVDELRSLRRLGRRPPAGSPSSDGPRGPRASRLLVN